jgi:mRNA interferase YafQ
MRVVQPSSFRKDVKRQIKRGKDLGKLKAIVDILIAGEPLPDRCVDHS